MSTSRSRWISSPRLGFAALTFFALFLGAHVALQGALASADRSGAIRLAQRAQPRISVAPAVTAEPASQVALPIQIGPPDALPRNSFVRLRGLPHVVSLTEGYSVGPGSWAIPLGALATLKANVPAGVSGRSELVISLVSSDGALLSEARTMFVVAAAA